MGRRYYCDYCDKTFIDDLDARKKHLSCAHHIKLRNLHYELHRDPKTVLFEESKKIPCRRFFQTGSCQFEASCRYSHYSQEKLWELKQQIELFEYEKRQKQLEKLDIPSTDSWVEKYNQKHKKGNSNVVAVTWTYPESLELRSDLPPSLKKFKQEDFTDSDFAEWGS